MELVRGRENGGGRDREEGKKRYIDKDIRKEEMKKV